MKDQIISLLVAVACVSLFALLPPLGLSSNDEGVRYIQMRNFNLHGSGAIQYPGATLGLKPEDVAKRQVELVERNGRLFATYPPFFAYLSSLLYPLLGDRVTSFLPLLAFLVCVVLLSPMLRMLLQGRFLYYLLLLGFILASPVYLQAFRFVEHVPAVCCMVCSLHFLVRYFRVKPSLSSLCLSASLLSIGIFFRPEVLLLAIPFASYLTFALCAQKQIKQAIAVLACTLAPIVFYALLNYRLCGSTLLLHLSYNLLGFHLPMRQTALAVVTLFFAIFFALLARKGSAEPVLKMHLYAFVGVLFIPFMLLVTASSPVPALFFTFPLVLLVFFAISERFEKILSEPLSLGNTLFVGVSGFLFLASWPFGADAGGSAGYCLPLVPFVIAIVAHQERSMLSAKPVAALVMVLLVLSFFYQAYTFERRIWNYKLYNAERTDFLKAATKRGDIIICASQPLLEHSGPLFFDRTFMVAEDRRELSRYVKLLKKKGIDRAYLWSHFGCPPPSDTLYTASPPTVFLSSRGPRNYLFTLSLSP